MWWGDEDLMGFTISMSFSTLLHSLFAQIVTSHWHVVCQVSFVFLSCQQETS